MVYHGKNILRNLLAFLLDVHSSPCVRSLTLNHRLPVNTSSVTAPGLANYSLCLPRYRTSSADMHFGNLALAVMATVGLAAPSPKRDILPTVVFTPGAWHGTWAFDTVRSQLEALGYPTEAVALPSVGNTNASVGVAEDAAALSAELTTLTDAGKNVVMVCHSYGGVVASSAVEGFGYKDRSAAGLGANGVIMLVYMTAFAAPAQTSLLDALGGEYLWWMTPDSTVSTSYNRIAFL